MEQFHSDGRGLNRRLPFLWAVHTLPERLPWPYTGQL